MFEAGRDFWWSWGPRMVNQSKLFGFIIGYLVFVNSLNLVCLVSWGEIYLKGNLGSLIRCLECLDCKNFSKISCDALITFIMDACFKYTMHLKVTNKCWTMYLILGIYLHIYTYRNINYVCIKITLLSEMCTTKRLGGIAWECSLDCGPLITNTSSDCWEQQELYQIFFSE